jgi:hypothetical protein
VILTLICWRCWERMSALNHGKGFLIEREVSGATYNMALNHLALSINSEPYLCNALLLLNPRLVRVCLFISSRAETTRI